MLNPVVEQQLLSEKISDIITDKPHWIIRRGSVICLAIFLTLCIFSWIIKSPDIITAPMRIVAEKAPKVSLAKTTGKIKKILVRNEDHVQANEYLAFIESTASHEEVLALNEWIAELLPKLSKIELSSLTSYHFPACARLGEMQKSYEQLRLDWNELFEMSGNGFYKKRMLSLSQELSHSQQISSTTAEEKKLAIQEYEIQKAEYLAKKRLFEEKVIALIEFNHDKALLISKEKHLQSINAQILSNAINEQTKRAAITTLEKDIQDHWLKFQSSIFNLQNELNNWIQSYIVTAPVSGKIFFASSLEENQTISQGQELFYIDESQNGFYCELIASQEGYGKIELFQEVIIKVNSYPFQEFGHLEGKVSHISTIPTKRDSFLVKVELVNGLRTTYNKILPFRNNLTASGDIITKQRRLLSRILSDFIKVY